MPDQTIVLTGASDGIGAAAARGLRAACEEVVVVGRSAQKTRAVAKELGADHFIADFADLGQVAALAAQLRDRYPRIDVLANNAGGIMGRRELTVDGYEKTFQVNHLAPFLLTRLLADVLVAGRGRVINTSSLANRFGRLQIEDLNAAGRYSPQRAYGNAKLANLLFTRELERRYGSRGLAAAAFHPGGVATNFSAGSTSLMRFAYAGPLRRLMLTPTQGADTLIWLAIGTPGIDWTSGEYYVRRKIARANRQAHDEELAAQLWQRSEDMVRPWLQPPAEGPYGLS